MITNHQSNEPENHAKSTALEGIHPLYANEQGEKTNGLAECIEQAKAIIKWKQTQYNELFKRQRQLGENLNRLRGLDGGEGYSENEDLFNDAGSTELKTKTPLDDLI